MKKKFPSLLILLIIYLVAIFIGGLVFVLLKDYVHYLLAIFIADVGATIFVWFTGLICKTASVYDPYWSLQTFFFYLGMLIYFKNWNAYTIIALAVIGIYSLRLTFNFIKGFHDLTYVDWRYKMLKEKSGKLFQLVNLFGICLFPTVVVYAASLPIFVYASLSLDKLSYFDLIGSIVILFGTLLELIADHQMKKFIKNRTSRSEVINIGLWKYSRHPNYLGEIIIWFGVAMILILIRPQYWYWSGGAFLNLVMFIFISIPMEEKHMLEYKPEMEKYIKNTSCLLLLPNRQNKEEEEEVKKV